VASNAYGDSPNSNVANATTQATHVPPAAPTGLTATAMSASEVDLSWTRGSTNEDGFKVSRSTDGVTFTQVGTAAAGATSFADTNGLAPSTRYYYRVVAFNTYGGSPNSNVASAATQALSPPAAPTGLIATAGQVQVSLRWTPATGATSYNVYRSTTRGGEGATPLVTRWSSSSFTDTTVAKGANYFYQVTAVGPGGESTRSSEAAAYVLTDNEHFVHSLFVDMLGREGTIAELDWWAGRLPVVGQAGVAAGIQYSSEAASHLVAGLYARFLGRSPVGGEEGYWATQVVQAGGTAEQVTAGILASHEFASRANALIGTTDADSNFILGLYSLLLHRTSATVTAAEIAGWKGVLTATSPGEVAAGILASAEFRSGAVRTLYGAEGFATSPYQPFIPDMLHRTVSPSAREVDFWLHSSFDLLRIEVGIASSREFFSNG
jgi:hypothetical protein